MDFGLGNRKLYLLILLSLVAIFFWGLSATPVTSMAQSAPYPLLHQDWSQLISDEWVPLENIQDFQEVPRGQILTFRRTLPPIRSSDVLLFYSENQNVTCYLEDELLHQFVTDKAFQVLNTPGNAWNQVDLSPEMSGKELTLTFSSATPRCLTNIYDIYLVENIDVDSVRANALWLRSIFTMALFMLMLATFLYAIIWKNPRRKRYFFTLGQLYLYYFLWVMGELQFYDFLFGRPSLSYLLSTFFMGLIPVALWRLAINSTDRYDHPKFSKSLGILALANALLPWLLLLFFGISPLESQWMQNFTLGALLVGLFVVILKKAFRFKRLDPEELPVLPLLFLLLGGLVEFGIDRVQPEKTVLTGLSLFVGCTLYTVFAYSILGRIDSKNAVEKVKIQRSYERLQVTSMMGQIKAHFIFNALNTISALCKTDPEKADDAIVPFAKYLRTYMFLSNQHDLIPVKRELDLIQAYLTMEKLRFEEALSFSLDLEFDDFWVPPLSLQPFVENAVMHGIRGRSTHGSVTITSLEEGDTAKIIIADTGVGFDTSRDWKQDNISIGAVSRRLQVMCGGTVEITSELGKGTQVIISIPLPHGDI